MQRDELRRRIRAVRGGRLPAYRVEEELRGEFDAALHLRRSTEERLPRRPPIVDRLLAEIGGDDENGRRHLRNRRYEDAVNDLERAKATLARVGELGRVLEAIERMRRRVATWRAEIDLVGALSRAATLRIPPRLVDEAESFALGGRTRAARLLLDMAGEELRRWSRDEERLGQGATPVPGEPVGGGDTAAPLATLAAAGRPRLAARLAEDLAGLPRRSGERQARRRRLLAALSDTLQRAESARHRLPLGEPPTSHPEGEEESR